MKLKTWLDKLLGVRLVESPLEKRVRVVKTLTKNTSLSRKRHVEAIIYSSDDKELDLKAVINYGTNTRCEVCGYIYGNAKAASDCAKTQKGRMNKLPTKGH